MTPKSAPERYYPGTRWHKTEWNTHSYHVARLIGRGIIPGGRTWARHAGIRVELLGVDGKGGWFNYGWLAIAGVSAIGLVVPLDMCDERGHSTCHPGKRPIAWQAVARHQIEGLHRGEMRCHPTPWVGYGTIHRTRAEAIAALFDRLRPDEAGS